MCRLWIWALVCGIALGMLPAAETRAGSTPATTVALVHEPRRDCSSHCAEWIVISGQITTETPRQLRAVLATLKGRHVPLILNSPGGRLSSALQLGRMIRAHGLTVAVGETVLLSETEGHVVPNTGSCKSACPFILAGGVERYTGAGTTIGLHQAMMVTQKPGGKRMQMLDQRSTLVAQSEANARLFRIMRGNVRSYLREMGVALALADEMEKAPPSSMNIVPLDRQGEFKLITGELTAADVTSTKSDSAYSSAEAGVLTP